MNDQRAIAFHESGHAVMAWALGLVVESVALVNRFDKKHGLPMNGRTCHSGPELAGGETS